VTIYPVPKPLSMPKPPKGLRKQNKIRACIEFERTYGSKARVAWIRLQPCACCGLWGYSENAHQDIDGAGLKSSYTLIAPMCGPRPGENGELYEGCHRLSHRDPEAFRRRFPHFNARKAAAKTHRDWLAFLRSGQ